MNIIARFRSLVPSHRVNNFVHLGNSLAVVASCSDDMVQLRSFMIGATSCNICFNLLQPTPLRTPAYWGCFFITAHGIQIARILREKSDVSMSEREHELYERCFLPHGFTPRQYLALLRESNAAWVTFAPGDTIARQGEEVRALHLVTGGTGSAVVHEEAQSAGSGGAGGSPLAHDGSLVRHRSATDGVIACLSQKSMRRSGFWVGDCWDPAHVCSHASNDGAAAVGLSVSSRLAQTITGGGGGGEGGPPPIQRWQTSVRAADGSLEAVRFDAGKFKAAMQQAGASALHSAERMQIEALKAHREHTGAYMLSYQARHKSRLRALEEAHLKERAAATYEAMVALAVADGTVSPEESRACAAFRSANGIDAERHLDALRKAGWSGRRL